MNDCLLKKARRCRAFFYGKEDARSTRLTFILLTHGHNDHIDHIGNPVEIAKRAGTKLAGTFDLLKAIMQYRCYPKDQATLATAGHFGGETALLDGEGKGGVRSNIARLISSLRPAGIDDA